MNERWRLAASVLILGGLAYGQASAREPKKPDAPHWMSDWQAARKAARESGKPLFVVFRCEH